MSRIIHDKALTFSGLVADSKEIPIERALLSKVEVTVGLTVTDASISAGETFNQLVDIMMLGDDANPVFDIRVGELTQLVAVTHRGLDVGYAEDTLPVTTVKTYATYILNGPFDTRRYPNPKFKLAIRNPNSVWGSATGFTAEVSLALETDDSGAAVAHDTRIVTIRKASNTDFQVLIPNNVDPENVFMFASVGGALTKWQGGASLDQPNAYLAHTAYASFKNLAFTQAPLTYAHISVGPALAASIQVQASSATALVTHFVGIPLGA